MVGVLLQKLTAPRLENKLTVFHGTKRFITEYTTISQLFLPQLEEYIL